MRRWRLQVIVIDGVPPPMKLAKVLEQHIAVFGEAGSGKTVLLSSFYGAAQEPTFLKESVFRLIADDIGQGHRLHRNFLGMRDEARVPMKDRFRQLVWPRVEAAYAGVWDAERPPSAADLGLSDRTAPHCED